MLSIKVLKSENLEAKIFFRATSDHKLWDIRCPLRDATSRIANENNVLLDCNLKTISGFK